jgi:CRP-like cAMP-binding protein
MTSRAPSGPPRENRLLATLPPAVYEAVLPYLEPVALSMQQVLYTPSTPISHVYFPRSAVVSLVVIMADDTRVEVATVGNEGLVGLPAYLGGYISPLQAFCQIPGSAWRTEAGQFREMVRRNEVLNNLLQRYTQALFNQISQAAACNRAHPIEERCARWLLMTHDRAVGDTFPLTHVFLAQMLGVRRATVTVVAGMLQQAGLIAYRRGVMTIVNRAGLEAASCECYRMIREDYERLFRGP